jgi:hypothetical protein
MLPPWQVIAIRAGIVVVAILAWFWTQAVLGKRVPTAESSVPLTDGIHRLTARWHARLLASERKANGLLISSSLVIDLLGAYLILSAICGPTFRAFVGIVVLFALRQICQMLCPLPPPDGMIWRHPGVPAVLVTYGTATDLFFSGHTAIAVFGAATLAGNFGGLGLAVGIAVALFEIGAVLVLRAHYTADVFTGIVCALWVYTLAGQWGPWVDGLIGRAVGS